MLLWSTPQGQQTLWQCTLCSWQCMVPHRYIVTVIEGVHLCSHLETVTVIQGVHLYSHLETQCPSFHVSGFCLAAVFWNAERFASRLDTKVGCHRLQFCVDSLDCLLQDQSCMEAITITLCPYFLNYQNIWWFAAKFGVITAAWVILLIQSVMWRARIVKVTGQQGFVALKCGLVLYDYEPVWWGRSGSYTFVIRVRGSVLIILSLLNCWTVCYHSCLSRCAPCTH